MPMLPGGTLWGDIVPGGLEGELSDGGIDADQVVDELLPSLHAASAADADLSFWTRNDLIQWMDEGLKRLARKAAVFIGRQASILSVPGTATYAHPLQHISTLHVSFGSTSLRPAAVIEIEARDPNFVTTPGTPDHWYENLLGQDAIGLTPVPDSEESIPQIYEGWPTALAADQTKAAAPAPVKGYLAMYVLAEAYGREGEMEMPDVAQHCKARVEFYEQIFQRYYGEGM